MTVERKIAFAKKKINLWKYAFVAFVIACCVQMLTQTFSKLVLLNLLLTVSNMHPEDDPLRVETCYVCS